MENTLLSASIMALSSAVQAWIIAILGWVWLTLLELGGVSLLAAHAFLGMLWLSTCNLLLIAFLPESRAPPAGYFGAVLAFSLSILFCILDTFESTSLGERRFSPPASNPANLTMSWQSNKPVNCTLARMHQVFYFSGSSMYLVYAGSVLGYLIVQLLVAASHMLDSDRRSSLWPGPAWGMALLTLLAFRGLVTFDGSASGGLEVDKQFFYFKLFSEPILLLSVAFGATFCVGVLMLVLEGLYMQNLTQRKFVRFFALGFTLLFFFASSLAFFDKGMLTTPLFIVLSLTIPPAVIGAVQATKAKALPSSVHTPTHHHPPPSSKTTARSVYNRVAPSNGRLIRHLIPVPVEMLSLAEKNKGV